MEQELPSGLMCFDKPVLLEKRIHLLQAIKESGSITTAAKQVGISYKTAWEAIDTMNNLSSKPLVVRTIGGTGGGGTSLTPYGEEIINNYAFFKQEYERLLKALSAMAEFNMDHIKNLQRIAMQISARNQLMGKIGEIKQAKVNAEISIVLKSGVVLISTITNSAIEEMGLHIGDEVVGIIKASSVLVSKDQDIATSARNKLKGIVSSIILGEVNAQVSINIGENEIIVATITSESVKNLGLEIGSSVCTLIKSSSILIGK